MRTVAALALTVFVSVSQSAAPHTGKLPEPFPRVGSEEAWAKLPRANPPLAPWARMLIGPLPKTTAMMLELDHLHRAKNPLGPECAALLQWTVADALGSKFGKATAEADLRRTKLRITDRLTAELRTAAAFARKLTLQGHAITDEEFADLLNLYGPEKVTAIVHTVAYANFHNRIVLGLGADGDPVPPLDVTFDPERLAKVATPPRPGWDDLKAAKGDGLSVRVEWGKANREELNRTLDRQKERKLRIPLPPASRLAELPAREREAAARILWNTVSSGYQPQMPRAWFAAMNAFRDESKVDRVFTNSMFWVVTRTNDCFY
jgi:alkylhydroperoxidase family enzyme